MFRVIRVKIYKPDEDFVEKEDARYNRFADGHVHERTVCREDFYTSDFKDCECLDISGSFIFLLISKN